MPYLAMWVVSMIGSVAVDHIIEKEMFFSRTGIRKISNTIATFGPAMALLGKHFVKYILITRTVRSKENVQGNCDSDSTCIYSAISKPNMTIKTKKLSILFGSDM